MCSSDLAAATVIEAKQAGEYSTRMLSRYRQLLDESFVMMDLKKYRKLPEYIATHPDLFATYPEMLNEAADEFLTIDGVPKKEKQRRIWKIVKSHRSVRRIVADIYKSWRAFG